MAELGFKYIAAMIRYPVWFNVSKYLDDYRFRKKGGPFEHVFLSMNGFASDDMMRNLIEKDLNEDSTID